MLVELYKRPVEEHNYLDYLLFNYTVEKPITLTYNLGLTPNCNYYNNCACVLVNIKVYIDRARRKIVDVTQSVINEGTGGKKKKKSCNFENKRDTLLEKILGNMNLKFK